MNRRKLGQILVLTAAAMLLAGCALQPLTDANGKLPKLKDLRVRCVVEQKPAESNVDPDATTSSSLEQPLPEG